MEVELDKAEIVTSKFQLGVGELRVQGGATKLMEGDFSYTNPSWKPAVRYSSTGFRGNLVIEQPSESKSINASANEYKWDVKLNDKVAQDFEFNVGVGVTKLDLSTINIRSMNLNMGVGEVELNLRGKPQKDYSVNIKGGVGEARILLPKDVAVVANATGGLGGVDTTGMTKEGNRYVNEAYKANPASGVTIRVNVEGGIGNVKLLCE